MRRGFFPITKTFNQDAYIVKEVPGNQCMCYQVAWQEVIVCLLYGPNNAEYLSDFRPEQSMFLASYAFTRINGAPSPRPHPDSPLMDLWATSPVLFRTYLVYFIWTQTKFKIDSWICCMLLLFLGKHQFLITQHFCSLSPLVSWQCLCMKEWMKVKLRRAVHCETVSLALTKVKESASQQMNYKEPLYEYTIYLNYG